MFWHPQPVDRSVFRRRPAAPDHPRDHRRRGQDPWTAQLSLLSRRSGTARIVTHSLADVEAVQEQLKHRPPDLWLICHSSFEDIATRIKNTFPGVRIALRDKIYFKLLLIEPGTVCLAGAGYEGGGRPGAPLAYQSRDAHDVCLEESFKVLWGQSRKIG